MILSCSCKKKAHDSMNYNEALPRQVAAGKSVAESNADSIWNEGYNSEQYERYVENKYVNVDEAPVSTFSIDVDTASYSNIRRFIQSGQKPPADAVRIEEMINYFKYDYPQPDGQAPFSITTEIAACPWNPGNYLALIGLQGQNMSSEQLPPGNIVFLIDVSGSMNSANKLPLLKSAFKLLVEQMNSNDRVSIVTYAGSAGLVLDSTPGSEKSKILDAIDSLNAGGSTAGAAGINLAYKIAEENFIESGNNRVILATDGDFNVGISSDDELVKLIEEKRDKGIFLTVLGFGMGNLKDSKMEKLADKGNGNYAYIDSLNEAKKVLVNEIGGTLFTIAKDVKIQVEFNPDIVKQYRLIGYENRMLSKEDFDDDTKDAGELGAGHSVTALYEIVLKDVNGTDKIAKNQKGFMTVNLRYKKPDANESTLITKTVGTEDLLGEMSNNMKFASAVAEFGMLMKDSQYKGNSSFTNVLELAKAGKGHDLEGYREEFIQLVQKALQLYSNN